MHDLVKMTIEAHGGLEQWKQVRKISGTLSASGPSFKQRGQVGEAFTRLPARVTADAREQKSVFEPFVASGQRGIYRPNHAVLESFDGTVIEELEHPRDALKNKVP